MEPLAILLLMGLIFGSGIKAENTEIVVKIEEDEYLKAKPAKSSNYIGICYNKRSSNWIAQRWSKKLKKIVRNGYYKEERKAAQASDTLARILLRDGEKGYKINFPDDTIEVYPESKPILTSNYFGVHYNKYNKKKSIWVAQRWSKKQKKDILNGSYNEETKAAQASDTLARKLMRNGEQGHKLNFPDDDTEVYPEGKIPASKYFGVCYHSCNSRWYAQRWSKKQKKRVHSGYFRCEREAAQASDALVRKLISDGEKGHQLNFTEEEYHQLHWETNHEIDEKEGIYSKRKRYSSGHLHSQQEYLVYKME